MGKGSKGGQSRNDQRSNSMNPNNSAHVASQGNRAVQLNPTSPAYKSSRATSTQNTESTSQKSEE